LPAPRRGRRRRRPARGAARGPPGARPPLLLGGLPANRPPSLTPPRSAAHEGGSLREASGIDQVECAHHGEGGAVLLPLIRRRAGLGRVGNPSPAAAPRSPGRRA